MGVSEETQPRNPELSWGELAHQLRDIERDIRLAELRIARGENVDQSEPDFEVDLRQYLDSLYREKAEVQQAMQSHVTQIEPATQQVNEQENTSDPWRFIGADLSIIEHTLRKTNGWPGARMRIDRHRKLTGGGVTSREVLQEYARAIQAGTLPFSSAIWTDVYDSYSSQGHEKKPKQSKHQATHARSVRDRRYFDPTDWQFTDEIERKKIRPDERRLTDAELESRAQRMQSLGLSTRNVSAYNGNSQGTSMISPEKGSHEQNPWDQVDKNKRADLQKIMAGTDTESLYGTPKSPLDTENSAGRRYQNHASQFARTLRPVESRDAERVGFGTMGNEPWTLDDFGEEPPKEPGDRESGDAIELTESSPSQHEPGEPDQFIDYGPLNPNGTPEREPGIEVPDELKGQIPQVPTFADLMADAQVLRDGLDDQIRNIAAAKMSREKLFGRHFKDREAKLKSEQGMLDQLHREYMDAWAYRLAMVEDMDKEFDRACDSFLSEIDARRERIAGIRVLKDSADTKASKISALESEIKQYEAAIAETEKRRAETKESIKDLREKATQNMIVDLATVRTRVEEAQTELKGGKGLARFKQLWKSKGGIAVRIAAGAGLVGLSLTGPIGVAVGAAGMAAMRGVGGYYGGEAIWNAGHRFREGRRARRDERTASSPLTEDQRATLGSDIEAIGTAIESTPENDGRQDRLDTEAFLRRNPMARAEIERVMRGEAEASAAIALQLMQDQRERIQRDAKSNRSAKIAGAVIGSTLAVAGLWRSLGIVRPPADGPKPYQPELDRLRGMVTARPEALQQWENMIANAPKGSTAAEAAFNQVYEQATQGLSRSQLMNLNRVIGRLSTIDGYGNAWTQQNMSDLVRQVKNGLSADEIIDKFNNIGGPNVGPANLN